MSIDKKTLLAHLPVIASTPEIASSLQLMKMLDNPHPVHVSLPAIDVMMNLPLLNPELLFDEELDIRNEPFKIHIPPSLIVAAKKYNECLEEGARLVFKAIKPLTDQYISSMRKSFNIVLAKDEVKRLERLLQRHPQRHDAKLRILSLRQEIKQREKEMKGSKRV